MALAIHSPEFAIEIPVRQRVQNASHLSVTLGSCVSILAGLSIIRRIHLLSSIYTHRNEILLRREQRIENPLPEITTVQIRDSPTRFISDWTRGLTGPFSSSSDPTRPIIKRPSLAVADQLTRFFSFPPSSSPPSPSSFVDPKLFDWAPPFSRRKKKK